LDFVDESCWPFPTSTMLGNKKETADQNPSKKEAAPGGNRKRPAQSLLSLRSLIGDDNKRAATTSTRTNNFRPATQVNNLARAFLRKAFRGPNRNPTKAITVNQEPDAISCPSFEENSGGHSNGDDISVDHQPSHDSETSSASAIGIDYGNQHRPSLLASKRPSSYITKPGASSRMSINNISMKMMLEKTKNNPKLENRFPKLEQFSDDDSAVATNGYYQEENGQMEQPVSLLGVGADEPIDEEDLKSILHDLSGMHAVVTCEDFGRVIEHGSVPHPQWGTILIRRGRVVRLGSAQKGFLAPDPRMEFQLPMEQLTDFVPSDKIRFDDERNLYLNGILTDFYYLQP